MTAARPSTGYPFVTRRQVLERLDRDPAFVREAIEIRGVHPKKGGWGQKARMEDEMSIHTPPHTNTIENALKSRDFEVLAARVVRKVLVSQFVGPCHEVLVDALKLIDEATRDVRLHLATIAPAAGSARVTRELVVQHVRRCAEMRLARHDVEEDERRVARQKINQEDFHQIFPSSWLDS